MSAKKVTSDFDQQTLKTSDAHFDSSSEKSGESLLEPSRRQFVLCNQHFNGNITIFTSEDSASKYDAFKELTPDQGNFHNILELQKQGLGIPLLRVKFHYFDEKYASVLKYNIPQGNVLFEEKKDNHEICTIRKKLFSSYVRYEFQFDFNDNKRFTVYFFMHYKLPIGDTTPFPNGNSYRWIHSEYHELWLKYSYSLFLLDEDDLSMTENMDQVSGKLDPKNNLVQGNILNLFKFRSRKVKDNLVPNVKLGSLNYSKRKSLGSYQRTAKFVLRSLEEARNLDSTLSVNDTDLMFLCISSILKRHEDKRKKRRYRMRTMAGAGSGS